MTSDITEQYACKCLNISITASASSSPPPEYPRDSSYTPVFIRDGGISVNHPQVTVRIPLKSEPLPGTSKYSQFTLLICLFCALPVYRVHNTISPEVEGSGSTLLPSEDWVEREILNSATGWIDVHKDSIRGDRLSELLKSPSYTSTFSVAFLPTFSSPSPVPEKDHPEPELPEAEQPPAEYLSDIRPLFLPPPFTLSHPIFVHLAGVATKQSEELRAAAERRIADFIKAEAVGLEREETVLRQQVEILWKSFRHNLDDVQRNRAQGLSNTGRSLSRSNPNNLTSSLHPSSSVTIRDFTPQRVSSPQRSDSSSSGPRLSALSASLATSEFYHPREIKEQSSSRSLSLNAGVASPRSALSSRTAVAQDGFLHDADTSTTYQYFVTLAEDMARYKEAQEQALKNQQEAEAAKRPAVDEPIGSESNTKIKETTNPGPPPEASKPKERKSPSHPRDKGKKVVTFVEPVIPEEKASKSSEDIMIFPFEEQPEEVGQTSISPQNTLQLLDQSLSRPRPRNTRSHNNAGHDAFATLRPSSLPAPSHIRPMRSQPGVDSSSHSVILNLPRGTNGSNRSDIRRETPPSPPPSSRPLTDNEQALLNLVATDVPSHRGAWRPESKAWQEYTRRQSSRGSSDDSDISEEDEGEAKPNAISVRTKATGDDDSRMVVGSMPINIINRFKPREQLSLASYRAPSAIPEEPAEPAGVTYIGSNKPLSSTAIRKALYSERDRHRDLDPGPLDFTTEDVTEDESEESEHEQTPEGSGEQSRRNALKIIQARDDLPAEGMWRSLA